MAPFTENTQLLYKDSEALLTSHLKTFLVESKPVK